MNIDWMIHAITETEEQQKNPNYMATYITDGFAKYGFGEIIVVGRIRDAYRIQTLINSFGCMFLEGEKFSPEYTHRVHFDEGEEDAVFNIVYGQYENGENWIQLVPHFDFQED